MAETIWFLLKSDHALLILLCLGVVLLRGRFRPMGQKIILWVTILLLMIAVFPVGPVLLLPLENRFSPPALPSKVEGVLVLGGAFAPELMRQRRTLVLKDAAERMVAFADLARRYPEARLVFAGGAGSLGSAELGDAYSASEFFKTMGIEGQRVALETKARNTWENATLTRQVVPDYQQTTWVLITTAYHMPRAYGAFRAAGWNVIPWPVDYHTAGSFSFDLGFDLQQGFNSVNVALREWGALAYYYLQGYIRDWLPSPGS